MAKHKLIDDRDKLATFTFNPSETFGTFYIGGIRGASAPTTQFTQMMMTVDSDVCTMTCLLEFFGETNEPKVTVLRHTGRADGRETTINFQHAIGATNSKMYVKVITGWTGYGFKVTLSSLDVYQSDATLITEDTSYVSEADFTVPNLLRYDVLNAGANVTIDINERGERTINAATSGFVHTSGDTMTGMLKTPSLSASYIQINTASSFTSGFTPSAGTISWNGDDKTINIGLDGGSVLQLGEEELIYAEFLRLDGATAFFSNIVFDNCAMFIGSNSIVFTTINGAQVYWFRYNNGYTRYGYLCTDPNALSVQIINNYYFGSAVSILASRPMFQNNYCESAGSVSLRCLNSAMVTGNRFYETDLLFYDNGAIMDGIINSNQFESSSSHTSRIRLISATNGTLMKGLTIVGNSFTGNLGTIMIAISVEGSYAGLGHHIKVTGNTTTEFNIKVPQTEGSSRNIKFYVTEGTNEVRLYLTGVNENTYNIFYIPGAMDPLDYIASTINHGIQSALFYLQSDGNVYQTCYTVINSIVPGAPTTDFQGSRANWSIYSSWEQ